MSTLVVHPESYAAVLPYSLISATSSLENAEISYAPIEKNVIFSYSVVPHCRISSSEIWRSGANNVDYLAFPEEKSWRFVAISSIGSSKWVCARGIKGVDYLALLTGKSWQFAAISSIGSSKRVCARGNKGMNYLALPREKSWQSAAISSVGSSKRVCTGEIEGVHRPEYISPMHSIDPNASVRQFSSTWAY